MCASAELQRFGDFVDDAAHGLARVVWTALPDRLGDGVVCVEGFRLGCGYMCSSTRPESTVAMMVDREASISLPLLRKISEWNSMSSLWNSSSLPFSPVCRSSAASRGSRDFTSIGAYRAAEVAAAVSMARRSSVRVRSCSLRCVECSFQWMTWVLSASHSSTGWETSPMHRRTVTTLAVSRLFATSRATVRETSNRRWNSASPRRPPRRRFTPGRLRAAAPTTSCVWSPRCAPNSAPRDPCLKRGSRGMPRE